MSNLSGDSRILSYTYKAPTADRPAEVTDLVMMTTSFTPCTDYVLDPTSGIIYRIPETPWRLDRQVRRVARRDMLKDCRQRARISREMKRRRKTIARWWSGSLSSRLTNRCATGSIRIKGIPDNWVGTGVIDDPQEVALFTKDGKVKAYPHDDGSGTKSVVGVLL